MISGPSVPIGITAEAEIEGVLAPPLSASVREKSGDRLSDSATLLWEEDSN